MTVGLARAENALEVALLAARRRSDVEPLLPVLADADVYLPTPARATSDVRDVPLALVHGGGEPFVPVFSSLAALARYRPEGGGYLRLSGRALAEAVPDGYAVVLDPGSDLAVPLRPDDLARLRDVPRREGDADLLIGEPREEPSAAIEAIRRFAAGRREIRAAYRALLVLRPGTEAEPVIGLELDAGWDGDAVVRDAAEAARAAGIDALALVTLDAGAAASPIGRFLLGRTKPFYTRAAAGS
jgi:SseB protein C-terminal domain/SseB protein N-terminal domain